MTLTLDYTLCDNDNCSMAAMCDRYQTLLTHRERLRSAKSEAEKIAAERNFDRVWLSDFEPDIRGLCDDYIPVLPLIHPPSQIDTPAA